MKLTQRRRMTAPSLGGLLASRQGSLLLALLCAVVAGILVLAALARFRTNISRPPPQATALIATRSIPKGTTGAQIVARHLYRATPVTSPQLVPGAISDASLLTDVTALATVNPGQQLTSSDFGTVIGVDQTLHGNQRALEIATSGANGAVDITEADSRVDIWSKPPQGAASLIATDVLVLKPATAAPVTIGNQPVAGSTLVLRVPEPLVRPILSDAPNLYLALRPGTGSSAAAAAPTSTTTATTTTTTTKGAKP